MRAPSTPVPAGPLTTFLDMDGTLAEHGVIPDAHLEAIDRARAAGHRVLVCTGRARCAVDDALVARLDGAVCSAGAWVELDGEVLRDHRYPAELAARTVEVLQHHGCHMFLEAPDVLATEVGSARAIMGAIVGSWARDEADDPADAAVLPDGVRALVGSIHEVDDPASVRFAKVLVFRAGAELAQIAREIGPAVRALPDSIGGDPMSGELQLSDVDKADGIDVVAAHLSLARESIVAIGDGMNDVGMLEHAGIAIAIEGSAPAVLEHADFTVAPPAGHGIVEAFARLGV